MTSEASDLFVNGPAAWGGEASCHSVRTVNDDTGQSSPSGPEPHSISQQYPERKWVPDEDLSLEVKSLRGLGFTGAR